MRAPRRFASTEFSDAPSEGTFRLYSSLTIRSDLPGDRAIGKTTSVKRRAGSDIPVRVGACIAVTLLHLPFIVAKRARERPAANEDALLVRFIDDKSSITEPARSLERPVPPKAAVSQRPPARSASAEEADIASPIQHRPSVDWYSESAAASAAAIDAIVREESYRHLGPYEKRFQIVEPKPPTPLFEQPKRKSGDIAPNPMGYDSVWYNEYCFTQLEQPVIPALPRGPGDGVLDTPFTCLFPMGASAPRGDLFEHLKKKWHKAPLPGEKAPE